MTNGSGDGAGAEGILSAASELFAERGFDAVSISAIAEKAGSSKANIFHHYGSKQGLYLEVLRMATRRLTEEFSRLLDSDQEPEVKIERAIRASLSALFEDECHMRLVFREVVEADPDRAEELARDVFEREFTKLTALFEEAQHRSGGDAGLDPAFLAFLLVSTNVMFLHCRHMIRHLPYGGFVNDRERYLEMLRDLLLRGVDRHSEKAREEVA